MKIILAGAIAAALAAVAWPCRAQYAPYVERPYVIERPRPSPAVNPPPDLPAEVSPSLGYAFRSSVPVPGGTVSIAGSPTFAASVDVSDWSQWHLELGYQLQETQIELVPQPSFMTQPPYGLMLHHLQIGGEVDLVPGHVKPFLGATIGAAFLAPQSNVPDELWTEATLEAGLKVMLTREFGFRAQAAATTIFMKPSSQIFCARGCSAPWYGSGVGLTQVAATLGPVVAF